MILLKGRHMTHDRLFTDEQLHVFKRTYIYLQLQQVAHDRDDQPVDRDTLFAFS